MALRPIPARILTHQAVLRVPVSVDTNRNVTYEDITLSRVCVQPTNQTRKSTENTQVLLRAMLFFDAHVSRPSGLDFDALKEQGDAAGSDLKIVYGTQTYTVERVDSCVDDTGRLHHTELELI